MLLLLFQSGYLLGDTPRQEVIDLDSWIEYDSGIIVGDQPNDELTSAYSQLVVKVATQQVPFVSTPYIMILHR